MGKAKGNSRMLQTVKFLFFAVMLFGSMILWGGKTEAMAVDYGYETKSFNVDLQVEEDNSILVEETISVYFKTPRHGIYRYIPKSGTAYYKAGEEVIQQNRKMRIDQVNVQGYDSETSTENGNLVIRIGSEDKTVTGNHTYKITYRCRLYDDKNPAYDLFYFNVLPQDWDNVIEKTRVRIQMPGQFDEKKLAVYSGDYGSTGLSKQFTVRTAGKTIYISGTYLYPGTGITVLEYLPEGYFVNELSNDWAYLAIFVTAIVTALLALVLWLLFGRDFKLVQTVEFSPPEDLTPAEIGFMIDESADRKDIVSMIIYFAAKGHLEIREEEDGRFLLRKKKELPEEAKSFEVTLMNGIFSGRKKEVYLEDLKETFYDTYSAAGEQLRYLYGKKGEKPLFYRSSGIARITGAVLMVLPLTLGSILASLFALESVSIIGCGASVLVFVLYLAGMILYDRKHSMSAKGYWIGNTLLSAAALTALLVSAYFLYQSADAVAAVVAAIGSVVAYWCTRQMGKRTRYGTAILGKILGFKEFIKTAELEKLKLLVEENPAYFYDILPYAYVFGLTDVWAKNFEEIAIEPPYWYDSYDGGFGGRMFHAGLFMHTFHSCTDTISQSIVIPSADEGSGGGFGGSFGSGGGFSGGGFGGGGGGSW